MSTHAHTVKTNTYFFYTNYTLFELYKTHIRVNEVLMRQLGCMKKSYIILESRERRT